MRGFLRSVFTRELARTAEEVASLYPRIGPLRAASMGYTTEEVSEALIRLARVGISLDPEHHINPIRQIGHTDIYALHDRDTGEIYHIPPIGDSSDGIAPCGYDEI